MSSDVPKVARFNEMFWDRCVSKKGTTTTEDDSYQINSMIRKKTMMLTPTRTTNDALFVLSCVMASMYTIVR